MKAVTIGADHTTRVADVDDPVLDTPTGVRVRMLEVGVCGTDAGICKGDEGTPPDGSDFLIPGHEGLGEVVDTGDDVEGFAPGDLVVPMVRRPCPHGHCAACRSGNQDFCITGDYTERGIQGAHGFAAEYIVEDQRYLCRVPAALRDVAVLTEPQSIAEKGLRQYLAIRRRLPWLRDSGTDELMDGCRAVVLGGGPVGLLGCLLLRLHGASTIVYSRTAPPTPEAEIADAVGADYVSSEESSFDDVVQRLGGVDLVYEAAGASGLMFEVMPHLSANAVFIATGVPEPGGDEEIAADDVMRRLVMRNQVLCGIVNASRDDFDAAIHSLTGMLERWPDALRGIITHRHPPDAFCDSAGSGDGLKHIIVPGQTP